MKMNQNNKKQIANLRDLGNLDGHQGKKVKENLLFRSGNLNHPIEVLEKELLPLGIEVVFDLRSMEETERTPYELPQGVEYRHRPILHSLKDTLKVLNTFFPKEKSGELTLDPDLLYSDNLVLDLGFKPGDLDIMWNIYQKMIANPKVFGDIIKEIIELKGRPILFHCSAGKDRTGVLAAYLLLLLGVDEKDIMQHYLLSNDYRREEIEKKQDELHNKDNHPLYIDLKNQLLLVKEEYLQAVFDSISKFDLLEDYAREKLGLDKIDFESLKALYLH